MEISNFTVQILRPSEGYKLCKGTSIISEEVYLSPNDNVEDWREIPNEEAEEILQRLLDSEAAYEAQITDKKINE